jgi:hypothetical protein
MEIKLGKAFEEMLARAGDPGGTRFIAGDLVVSRVRRTVAGRQAKSSEAEPAAGTAGASASKATATKKVASKTARSPRAKKPASRRRGSSPA